MGSPLGSASSIHGLLSPVSNKEACKQLADVAKASALLKTTNLDSVPINMKIHNKQFPMDKSV